MVTRAEFWAMMGTYGARIWPWQLAFYLAAAAIVGWLLLKPGWAPSLATRIYLALALAWNGIFFYLVYARSLSDGSHYLGTIFLFLALVLAVDPFRRRMAFTLPNVAWQRALTLGLLALTFLYPLISLLSGLGWTGALYPGTTPCPTVALATLLLVMALPGADRLALGLLIFPGVPFTPFYQIARYGVYEDLILLASGVFGIYMLVRYWKSPRRSQA
jgi:hypothetical protein